MRVVAVGDCCGFGFCLRVPFAVVAAAAATVVDHVVVALFVFV